MASGLRKELRCAYDFDEVALVPVDVAANLFRVDPSWKIGEHKLSIPVVASATDAVAHPHFAILFGRLGGLAVWNLEGFQTRDIPVVASPVTTAKHISTGKPDLALEQFCASTRVPAPVGNCVVRKGYHWRTTVPQPGLPRSTRIRIAINGSLQKTLFSPTSKTDRTQNLMGALRTTMAARGARNITEMQRAQMIVAPTVATEGKIWQPTGSN